MRRTHRACAITSFVFVILITLSGLILNHADTIGLSSRYTTGSIAQHVYGIDPPPIDVAYAAAGVSFAIAGETLYVDGIGLASGVYQLRGAVASPDGIVVATSSEIFVTTDSGQLIERLATDLPFGLMRLGSAENRVVATNEDKLFAFDTLNMHFVELEADTLAGVTWSEPVTLEQDQSQIVRRAALSQILTWERVLSDLHSGRILPTVGTYIADLTAVCLLYLCISGAVLWFRRR